MVIYILLAAALLSAKKKTMLILDFSSEHISNSKTELFSMLLTRTVYETRVYNVLRISDLNTNNAGAEKCHSFSCAKAYLDFTNFDLVLIPTVTALGQAYIFMFDVYSISKNKKSGSYTVNSDSLDKVAAIIKNAGYNICGYKPGEKTFSVFGGQTASQADQRQLAVNLSLGPAIISVDYEKGKFATFASGSVLLPFLYRYAFALGAGPSFKISSHWRYDIFGLISLYGDTKPHLEYYYTYNGYKERQDFYLGLGLGMGFHFTSDSGFTLGFKIPFIGGTIANHNQDNYESLGYYYLSTAASLPSISIGYRF